MKNEKIIHILAGVLILTSLTMSLFVNQWWLLLTAIIGLNLLVDGLTGFCIARKILEKIRRN